MIKKKIKIMVTLYSKAQFVNIVLLMYIFTYTKILTFQVVYFYMNVL